MKNAHPNATVAGGTSGAGVALVWLLGYLGVHISAEIAVVIAGALTTLALFVGRNGVAGVWRLIVNGNKT